MTATTKCALCDQPADGVAYIDDRRYCHGEQRPSCYERAQWTWVSIPSSPGMVLCPCGWAYEGDDTLTAYADHTEGHARQRVADEARVAAVVARDTRWNARHVDQQRVTRDAKEADL